MRTDHYRVTSVELVAENTFLIGFTAPFISEHVRPGQFINLRATDSVEPLLRRPFSVCNVAGDTISILFNAVGKGTDLLCRKKPGDVLDVLGPLGSPFSTDANQFDTALLVAGGLGVAPLPISQTHLKRLGKKVRCFVGMRSMKNLPDLGLENLVVATDDGTGGFHGNVVDLLKRELPALAGERIKMFGCGPTAMLKSLAKLARENNLACEVALEGPMACGFGICQGCPVELAGAEKKYALMCKDGPAFDIQSIVF